MSESTQNENENEFWDDLAGIVDGDDALIEKHADLLGMSDEFRDARFEGQAVADAVAEAGADYEEPEDLEARLMAALDARGPATDEVAGTNDTLPAGSGALDPSAVAEAAADVSGERGRLPARSDLGATVHQQELPPEHRESTQQTSNVSQLKKGGKGPVLLVLGAFAAAALALLALVGVGAFSLMGNDSGDEADTPPVLAAMGAISARVVRVERAAADGQNGVRMTVNGGTAMPLAAGAQVPSGAIITTDDRTRTRLELSDGSTVTLNHATTLALIGSVPRRVELREGELVADVAHLDQGPAAVYGTPTGHIEVLGTKFVLSATENVASVRVTRGAVRAHGAGGSAVEVKAGQEGILPNGAGPSVSPAMRLAADVAWSELGGADGATERGIRGLGELRARRPGERDDQERPLTLASHRSTVRLVGNVARTEIEEVFRNDGDHVLEGIYRFPLPSDAQISSLQLEVDGEWEEGAFVERDRAAQIWRGVIRNATAPRQRRQREEFIWVPGPWRDPALLEWQRGGRFELKIFPIPAHGERRMRITYTQNLRPHGRSARRYVHPLPFSPDESTRVGRFELDVRVTGHDGEVRPHGYQMTQRADGNSAQLNYVADDFLAKGDLIIDFDMQNPDAEIRWWTFSGDATAAAPTQTREGSAEILAAHRALNQDSRGYAVFAIRPDLPAWTQSQSRDYVIVVDSSQSMVGERYERATELTQRLVGEMDRRDRFMVVACDATCQAMGPTPATPTSQTATQTATFLSGIRPAGASDVGASLRAAVDTIRDGREAGRDVRVIYIGDGVASVGHRRASSLADEVDALAGGDPQLSFTTVGIGGDSDTLNLSAIARAGGGHYVPYVPGQRVATAALAVLETTYGTSLTNASVRMPGGVSEIAPTQLSTIRAGEELLVVARLDQNDIRGEIVLSGKVGGRPFEDRYPVNLTASTARGNAFVPRQWAAASIEELELGGKGEDVPRIIALSKAFGVMSRHTSLLVLESEAMFRAFGVDRNQPTVQWTGDEDMEMGEGTGLAEYGTLGALRHDSSGASAGFGGLADMLSGAPGSGGGGAPSSAATRSAPGPRRRMGRRPADVQAAPEPVREMEAREDNVDVEQPQIRPNASPPRVPLRGRRGGQWMRREWFRTGTIQTDTNIRSAWHGRVTEAESALRQSPDSRDRHRDLVRALTRVGELTRAEEVAEAWISRDRLDPEALTYLSDIIGRQGNRPEALRLLSGIVDLRPDERVLHERMANAFDRAGMPDRACAHRVSLAEIRPDDDDVQADAVRCERGLSRRRGADRVLSALENDEARSRVERALARNVAPTRPRGELLLDASWGGSTDVDLSLITPQGTRISWMGGRRNVVGEDGSRSGGEKLGLRRATPGSYMVEVNRADPDDRTPVTGRIEVRAFGQRRTIPFTLTGERVVVGRIDVRRESRMVQGGR
ncbi:MAG: FecR domain-containing protein [Deltaproteobacteria bacterium]|nr:FecR domain-containing protein [Deltaproteobacteria bacterium]